MIEYGDIGERPTGTTTYARDDQFVLWGIDTDTDYQARLLTLTGISVPGDLQFIAEMDDEGEVEKFLTSINIVTFERMLELGIIRYVRDEAKEKQRFLNGQLDKIEAWIDREAPLHAPSLSPVAKQMSSGSFPDQHEGARRQAVEYIRTLDRDYGLRESIETPEHVTLDLKKRAEILKLRIGTDVFGIELHMLKKITEPAVPQEGG